MVEAQGKVDRSVVLMQLSLQMPLEQCYESLISRMRR
jgi:hypothetical protein